MDMNRIHNSSAKKVTGGIALTLVCEHCGKPLVKTSSVGMFCEDECGKEEAVKAGEKLKKMLESFEKLFT